MFFRILAVATLSSMFAVAHAGTVLTTTNHEVANNSDSSTTVYAQNGKLRVETGGPQDGVAIFTNDTLYSIDPKKRSYVAIDRESMQKMAAEINPALQQMRQQLDKMSPEQRAQMERAFGSKVPGMGKKPVEQIRKTSRTDKVAGYACSYVEVVQDDVVANEVCVVPPDALKGSKDLYDASVKVSALMEEILSSIDAPWLKQMATRQIENYTKLGGIPVLTRSFIDGKTTRESTLKSIATAALPATTFEIPKGYTKQEIVPGN